MVITVHLTGFGLGFVSGATCMLGEATGFIKSTVPLSHAIVRNENGKIITSKVKHFDAKVSPLVFKEVRCTNNKSELFVFPAMRDAVETEPLSTSPTIQVGKVST